MDLSLTGSQVGTPVNSSRRPGSAKSSGRLGSASAPRIKPQRNVNGGTANATGPKKTSTGCGPATPVSGRSDVSSIAIGDSARSQTSARDDFLALFESSTQSKSAKSKAQKSKPAWATPVNSARSTSTVNSEGDKASRTTSKASSKFSHSIFQPTSARSTSTVDDEEEEVNEETDFGNLNLNLGSAGSAGPDKAQNNVSARNRPSAKSPVTPSQSARSTGANNKLAGTCRASPRAGPSTTQTCSSGFGPTRARQNEEDLAHSHTYSVHANKCGNNEFDNTCHEDPVSQKATKLNSIANNMTSQAFSPGAKASLMGMENSYQNLKHKTPINQVRQSPQSQVGRNVAENYIKKCNMAATRIQRWYRRRLKRHKSGEAAMRRLLDGKRQEKEEERLRDQDAERRTEDDRRRTREDRARQARQQAIEELQKKREEKRQTQQDIAYLQPGGAVTKTPSHRTNAGTRKQKGASRGPVSDNHGSDSDTEGKKSGRPGTGSSTGRRVEELFQSVTENTMDSQSSGISPRNVAELEKMNGSSDEATPRASEVNGETTRAGSVAPSSHKSTLDDLMATLSKLEQEEKLQSARGDKKNEKPLSWLDDLEKPSSDKGEMEEFLLADKLDTLNSKDNLKKSGMLTDEKLRSIIHYLDEVDRSERVSEVDQDLARVNATLECPAMLLPSGEELEQMEAVSHHVSEVSSTMVSQKMELEDKKRTVQMLQKALNQQRELTVRHAKETEREMKKRLHIQKGEYEDAIKRHLSFIDQLIEDKKALSDRCEQLVKELKSVDKKAQDKIKHLQDNQEVEVRKLKEVSVATEKLRREKWIDEKTKKIKEMTVKGLEPEIQRLIAKHKAEIKKLKSIHEAELLSSDDKAGGRYVKMNEELRDQLAHEKETACARERELARQTYEKQLQQEEEAYQQARRRLYQEVHDEKERNAQAAARQRAELDRLQRQLEDQHNTSTQAMREEYEKAREEQEKRHVNELRQQREKLAVEKQVWEENYMKKKEAWITGRERELKDTVRQERDKEIELVIRRLEEDNASSREECERVAENRIKRIRDKYESEISEMERTEKHTTDKYNQVKAKLAEVEGEHERMKVNLRQKDREINELKKLLDRLNDERDRVSDVIRQEFADRIVSTEEENRRVKNDMSELKAKHRMEQERIKGEMEIMQRSKEEEMEEVHKRVKEAILKKEENVTQLRKQHEAALKRADHLEGLLEQQRKQLLSLGRK